MSININDLTETELAELNNRIVERLRFLHQARAHSRMLEFKIGDRVSFEPNGRPPLIGILARYNKKTVTVITDGGERWNVAPSLLHRVLESDNANAQYPNVIPFSKG